MGHFLSGKLCSEAMITVDSSKSTWITIMTPVALARAAIILMVVATACSIESAQAVHVTHYHSEHSQFISVGGTVIQQHAAQQLALSGVPGKCSIMLCEHAIALSVQLQTSMTAAFLQGHGQLSGFLGVCGILCLDC